MRFTSDGVLDDTFGDGGVVTTRFGAMYEANPVGMVVQADGKVAVSGCRRNKVTNIQRTALARYEPDGLPDPTFSGNGRLVTSWTAGGCTPLVALDPDGRFVTGGSRTYRGGFAIAAARYLAA